METNKCTRKRQSCKQKQNGRQFLALSNQNDAEQLKENAKNQNSLKAYPTCLKFWQKGATEKICQRETRRVRAGTTR